VVIILSILGQLLLAFVYVKEALLTPEGRFCRVKCGLAAGFFFGMATLLSWLFAAFSANGK
jgi:hypothetical protein